MVRRVITLPIHRPALSWLLRAQNRTKSIKKIQEMASTASKSLGALFEGDDGTDTDKFDNENLGCESAQYKPVCAQHKAALEAGWKQARPKPAAYVGAGSGAH